MARNLTTLAPGGTAGLRLPLGDCAQSPVGSALHRNARETAPRQAHFTGDTGCNAGASRDRRAPIAVSPHAPAQAGAALISATSAAWMAACMRRLPCCRANFLLSPGDCG